MCHPLLAAGLLALSAVPLAAQGGCTTPSFGDPVAVPVGDSPRAVALGHFDADQQLDLVTTFGTPGSAFGVTLRLGDGSGTFAPGVDYPSGGDAPFYLATADLNGDGFSDLVIPHEFSDTLAVMLGGGAGDVLAPVLYPVGATPWSVAVADLNDDGNLDVACVCAGAATVEVFLGDGSGALAFSADYATMPQPRTAVLDDFDGDGNLDLAVAGAGASDAWVRAGFGTGAFGAPAPVAIGGAAQWLASGDFDEDGARDLVAAVTGIDDAVAVVRRTPAGGFQPPVFAAFSTSPRSIEVADFDFDGHEDLLVVNDESFPVGVLVLEGDGAGNFAAATTIPFVAGFDAAVGDLNANGTLELVYPVPALDQLQVVFSDCVPRAGSADGLFLTSEVGNLPVSPVSGTDPVKTVSAGESLDVSFGSLAPALLGAPCCVSYEVVTTGPVPPPLGAFPALHLDPGSANVAFAGTLPFLPLALPAAVPAGLEGNSILVQGFALAPTVAANGWFAATDAHELQVVAP